MSQSQSDRIVLGSGSPRRLELLSLLVPRDRIDVVVPECEELSFDGVHTAEQIRELLQENVDRKKRAVAGTLQACNSERALLCADTIVVVQEADGRFRCLGKPPQDEWQSAVRDWFRKYYSVGPHWVWTGFSIDDQHSSYQNIEVTEVTFRSDASEFVSWYVGTEESVGKAGGYAIQGAGSIFAERVLGSLSNVIGLPLEPVLLALQEFGFVAEAKHDTAG